jgi:hypothetical protein
MILDNTLKSDLTALLIFICFWISLLGFTRTPFSGIHFQDDHQILTIKNELSSQNLSAVISKYVKKDLNIRLRPFYYVHRVSITNILGKNILFWSIYTGLLAILTSFFFYKFIRLLNFSFLESLLFSFLTLIGPHTCIWWKLGPAETIGTFLLSLTLFFISKSILSRHKIWYKTLTIVFIILCALTKESFLILIPTLVLFYLFFSSKINKVSWQIILQKNYPYISILSIIFILPIILIFRNIGVNTIGYAGLSNNYYSIDFIKWIIVQFYKNIYFIIIIFGFFLMIQNTSVKSFKELTRLLYKTFVDHFFILLIFLSVFIPQCLLYFKSGIETRYYIPYVLGFSILVIYLLNIVISGSTYTYISKYSFITLIVIAIIYLNFKQVIPSAIKFSDEGFHTRNFIDNIVKHSVPSDKILFVIDPGSEYEWGYFLREYFENELNRPNFQFLQVFSNYTYSQSISKDLFSQIFQKYLAQPGDLIEEKYSIIAILPLSFDIFNKESSAFIKSSKYICINNSAFNVYYYNK